MSTNLLLEENLATHRASEDSLSDIVKTYSKPLPKTEWLTRLQLVGPHQKLTCLPLSTRVAKRTFDIVGSLTLLFLCSPIMLLTAVLVKLTSPGTIIYCQTRVGINLRKKSKPDRRQNYDAVPNGLEERRGTGQDRREEFNYGQPFTIYKFRTMRNDAEKGGAQFAQESDPRVTIIGRFLRRTRIDELPQLWNILKGDMALVGPRPERPDLWKNSHERSQTILNVWA